uniref:Uncharacterized protein n=1 Tax=Mustela putorius furo TaxID=9669 RepID=M3YGR1_MUSPF
TSQTSVIQTLALLLEWGWGESHHFCLLLGPCPESGHPTVQQFTVHGNNKQKAVPRLFSSSFLLQCLGTLLHSVLSAVHRSHPQSALPLTKKQSIPRALPAVWPARRRPTVPPRVRPLSSSPSDSSADSDALSGKSSPICWNLPDCASHMYLTVTLNSAISYLKSFSTRACSGVSISPSLPTSWSDSSVTTPLRRAVGRPSCLSCGSMEWGNCSRGRGSRVAVKVALFPAGAKSTLAYFVNHSFTSSLLRWVKRTPTSPLNFLLT